MSNPTQPNFDHHEGVSWEPGDLTDSRQPPADDTEALTRQAYDEDGLDRRFVAKNYVPQEPVQGSTADPELSGRVRTRMFCFECNRQEGHFVSESNRFIYSFILGLTFGLAYLIGPYTCQCCGSQRLFRYDRLHPYYWFQSAKHRSQRSKKSRRRKRQ